MAIASRRAKQMQRKPCSTWPPAKRMKRDSANFFVPTSCVNERARPARLFDPSSKHCPELIGTAAQPSPGVPSRMILLEFPFDATSGLELRVAHRNETPGCTAVAFPNQRLLPVFVEPHAYIRGNEFVSARLAGPDEAGYFSVEVEVRETAARKINKLAKKSERVGMGVFRHGRPVS